MHAEPFVVFGATNLRVVCVEICAPPAEAGVAHNDRGCLCDEIKVDEAVIGGANDPFPATKVLLPESLSFVRVVGDK